MYYTAESCYKQLFWLPTLRKLKKARAIHSTDPTPCIYILQCIYLYTSAV